LELQNEKVSMKSLKLKNENKRERKREKRREKRMPKLEPWCCYIVFPAPKVTNMF